MAEIKEYRVYLGQHISELRRERHVSQESLCFAVGISRTYMGYIEQGVRTPSIDTLLGICEALDVRMPDLFDFPWPVGVEYSSKKTDDAQG